MCATLISAGVCAKYRHIKLFQFYTLVYTIDVVFGFVEAFINTVFNSPPALSNMQKCVFAAFRIMSLHSQFTLECGPILLLTFLFARKSSVSSSQITIFTHHLAFIYFFFIWGEDIGTPYTRLGLVSYSWPWILFGIETLKYILRGPLVTKGNVFSVVPTGHNM